MTWWNSFTGLAVTDQVGTWVKESSTNEEIGMSDPAVETMMTIMRAIMTEEMVVETTMTTTRTIMTEEMIVETIETEAVIATDMNDALVAMTTMIRQFPRSKIRQSCLS